MPNEEVEEVNEDEIETLEGQTQEDTESTEESTDDAVAGQEESGAFDYEAEGQKRGFRALFKEIDSKKKDYLKIKEENEELKKKLSGLDNFAKKETANNFIETDVDSMSDDDVINLAKKNPRYKRLVEIKESDGFSKEHIAQDLRASSLALESTISPLSETLHERKLNDSLDRLAKDDKYKFVVTKFRDKIKGSLTDLGVPSKFWGNDMALMTAIGRLVIENPEIMQAEPKKRISKDIAMETESKQASTSTGGVSTSELKEYAEMYGVDLTNPIARKSAIEGLKAKKSALSKIGG